MAPERDPQVEKTLDLRQSSIEANQLEISGQHAEAQKLRARIVKIARERLVRFINDIFGDARFATEGQYPGTETFTRDHRFSANGTTYTIEQSCIHSDRQIGWDEFIITDHSDEKTQKLILGGGCVLIADNQNLGLELNPNDPKNLKQFTDMMTGLEAVLKTHSGKIQSSLSRKLSGFIARARKNLDEVLETFSPLDSFLN